LQRLLPKGEYALGQKIEIAKRIHQEAGISEEEAAMLLNWLLELFKSTLQKGESISVTKFGVFRIRRKSARKGRNPKTGKEVMIPPRRVVTFHASFHLKNEVNAVPVEPQEMVGLLPEGK
jgi:integration host factor subunit alpha